MNTAHFILISFITLTSILLLAFGWEFWIEDIVLPLLPIDYDKETAFERWEYVISITVFAFLALIIPTYITISLANQRKQTEDRIKASLVENEMLLQEIHHRVKNNLQMISSMLWLQANTENNTHTVEVLRDSYRRVMVMAQIHESLHRQNDLNVINARDFMNTLITDTKMSSGGVSKHLSFHVYVDEIPLDVIHANGYGQIISELLSNSLKHAFADGQSGNIEVSLHRQDGGGTELIVADDGKGLPEDFDLQQTKTLGLRLVQSLAMKLGGAIHMDGTGGTRVQINFPQERL